MSIPELENKRKLEHLWRMRETLQRNVYRLQEQAASQGLSVPITISNELAKAEADLARVEAALGSNGTIETAESLGDGGRFLALSKNLAELQQFLRDWSDESRREREAWQAEDDIRRARSQTEYVTDRRSLHRTLTILGASALFVILSLACALSLALAVIGYQIGVVGT